MARTTGVKLQAPGFGQVVVNGEVWDKDVCVRADGSVKKRKKRLAKEAYGSGHVVGPAELEGVCRGAPQVLVIGSGYAGALTLCAEGRQWLQERGIAVEVLPTPRAVQRFLELEGPRAALIHVTC